MMASWLTVGISALRLNPMRTSLATAGVVIGVAALVAVLAIGDGVEQFARDQIERSTDLQAIVVSPVTSRLIDSQRVPRNDFPRFEPADVADAIQRLPPLAVGAISMTGTALLEAANGDERAVLVTACTPAIWKMTELTLDRGRFFSRDETARAAPVAVISQALATAAEATVGDTLVLQGTALKIVGVQQAISRDSFLRAFVPIGVGEQVMIPRTEPRGPQISFKVAQVEQVPAAETTIRDWLTERHGDWDGRATVSSNRSRVRQARQGMLIFKILMGAVTGISLLVGGIGIMNVLLASVAERTREIGLRRSVGARSRDVLLQFLTESVGVTGVGCVLGTVLGWVGAFGVTALMRAKTEALVYAQASFSGLVVAAIAALSIGIGFGIYPALRASRLSPIDAIRHE